MQQDYDASGGDLNLAVQREYNPAYKSAEGYYEAKNGLSLAPGNEGCSLSDIERTAAGINAVGGAAETILAGVGGARIAPNKGGLTTPSKYFGSKTTKQAEKALQKKFGAPRGQGPHNKSFYNEKTGRTYNLHTDPAHRGGRPHIDVRKRNLPTNYYKDKPFFLKE